MIGQTTDIKQKNELFSKLSLLSELRADGFDIAIRHKFGADYEYLVSFRGFTNEQLYAERMRLRETLNRLD